MARRRTKEQAKRHQRRKVTKATGRQAFYRHGLIDAIGKLLPGQFFSRWPVAGSKWSPLRVFWMALLMVWSTEQTLQARFEETRDMARRLFPKWPLGKSYTGWYEAQLKWLTPMQPALSKRLRRQMQAVAGRHWQREGLVCVRGGRFAGGVSADRGQRTGAEVCGPQENRSAVVRDDAVAHGHGLAVGFSHRSGDG